jgi:hypothetical protein
MLFNETIPPDIHAAYLLLLQSRSRSARTSTSLGPKRRRPAPCAPTSLQSVPNSPAARRPRRSPCSSRRRAKLRRPPSQWQTAMVLARGPGSQWQTSLPTLQVCMGERVMVL